MIRRAAPLFLTAALLAAAVPVGAGEGDAELRSFTLAAGGDVVIHRSFAHVADQYAPGWNTYDFTPMLEAIEPWISEADLAICHMEAVLSPTNTGLAFYPRFVAPHELADALAEVGFDACSTASNHALDNGLAGLADTLEILQGAGLRTVGTARTPEERLPNLYDVNGVTVGHLAYTYDLNGWHRTEPWSVNFIDAETILTDAAWAREQGAEFTILTMHWGTEYRVPPDNQQLTLAEELLASPDIDLILGHHTHVVQPIHKIGDEWVVYGMANLLGGIRTNPDRGRYQTENAIITHAEVTEQPDGRFLVEHVEYTPIWADIGTKNVLPVGHSLLTGAGDPAVLQRAWQSTVGRVNSMGPSPATPTNDPWPALSCNGLPATILGTPGDDVLIGTDGDDVIVGRGGDDSIWAGDGDDLVCSGDGDDFVNGGDGDDRLQGGDGDDLLLGYAGADVVWGDEGDDVLGGGGGTDLLVGGAGDDGLQGGDGADFLWGGSGVNRSDATTEDHCVAAGCD